MVRAVGVWRMKGFESREEVEEWAQDIGTAARTAIATRAALRVLPLALEFEPAAKEDLELAAISSFRAVLTTSVSVMFDTEVVRLATTFAAFAADFADSASRSAAYAAARTTSRVAAAYLADTAAVAERLVASVTLSRADADSARSQIWSAISLDAAKIDLARPEAIFSVPLWHDAATNLLDPTQPEGLVALWDSNPSTWAFWRDFYLGHLEGRTPDWSLWQDIALLPDADWKHGPAHIAGKIVEVQARLLARRLPLSETIRFDTALGGFVAEPVAITRPALVSTTLARVGDTLDDVLADITNGLSDRDPEPRQLRRMLDRYTNDPQRIEMDVTAAQRNLMRRITNEDLPASASMLALVDSLGECGQAVRGSNGEIAENRHLLDTIAFRELTPVQRAELGKVQPVILDLTKGRLHEDMVQDIPLLLYGELTQAGDAPIRVSSRTARIWLELKRLINKAEESEARKALGQVADAAAVVTLLGAAVAILFGVILL